MADRQGTLPRFTPVEFEIMKVLWREGPLSAREVHESLGDRVDWAYTTTRTNVDRMVAKGLISKASMHGIHVFSPAVSRVVGLARRVHEFASQVLESGHQPVVSLFAATGTLTDDEIKELQSLLDADDGVLESTP